MYKFISGILLLGVLGLLSCQTPQPPQPQKQSEIIRSDFKKYYEPYRFEGSFVLYNPQKDQYTFYNKVQFNSEFTPASTFKICNSLIGLETGVIPDENFVLPWDGVKRFNPDWNKDHNLKTAYQNSVVWYYQELARRVGELEMKKWMDTIQFGNRDISGGIDHFWLNGGMRITPKQQIDFLKRLHENQLPFSQRSLDKVKEIMIAKDTLGYVLRAKTGWGQQDQKEIGWYVGYVEKNKEVYYFANCVQTTEEPNKELLNARKEIVYAILKDLGIVENW